MLWALASWATLGPIWLPLLVAPHPLVHMVVCHNRTTLMTFLAIFHADLCTKCFKLHTPGSFTKHAQGCDEILPPSAATVKKWKNTVSLLGRSPAPEECQESFICCKGQDLGSKTGSTVCIPFVPFLVYRGQETRGPLYLKLVQHSVCNQCAEHTFYHKSQTYKVCY